MTDQPQQERRRTMSAVPHTALPWTPPAQSTHSTAGVWPDTRKAAGHEPQKRHTSEPKSHIAPNSWLHELVLAEIGSEGATHQPRHHLDTGVDTVHTTFGRTNSRQLLPRLQAAANRGQESGTNFAKGHVVTTTAAHEWVQDQPRPTQPTRMETEMTPDPGRRRTHQPGP